jgi:hypothetical protein
MYDPVANTWTSKADFPGSRYQPAGFATDSFGYVGAGKVNSGSGTSRRDFYKYDPNLNTWTPIANYPDTGVTGAHSFGINNLGYVISGLSDTAANNKRGYAYDRSTDSWTRIADIPHAMNGGFSAVANLKGYCGWGSVDSVYEYDPGSNLWQRKATDSAFIYSGANWFTFSIYNKIYVCDGNGTHADMRVFDPAANSWSRSDVFPYMCTNFTPDAGFNIGNTGYLGATNSCQGYSFWQYDTAHYFTISAVTPDTICPNDQVTVSFSSDLSFGGGNYFKLKIEGNNFTVNSDSILASSAGTYSFHLPANHIYPASINPTNVSVLSTSTAAQAGYFAPNLYIKKGPTEGPLADSFKSCGGSAVLLYRANAGGQTTVWTSYPAGVNDSLYSLSFTPTQNTTIFFTDVYTSTGCSVSDSTHVLLYAHPGVNISDSVFAICAGTSVTIGGTSSTNCSYTWTGGTSSSSVNPTVSPAANSTYHLFVKDTVSGCSSSGNTIVDVKYAPAQTICFVTVDTASTHNIVVWEKLDKYATDSFYIFRETTTNNYTRIAAVHRDSLSEYHDYTANPNVTGYRYKISAGDTCNNTSTMSPYHNTIHLQYLGGGNLIWNVYEIENATQTPVSSFDVYWDTLANGNWQVMINVPGNQYTATDINFTMHPTARYRIVANWSYSCTPTRSSNSVLSNIIQLAPNGINTIDATQSISVYPNPAKNELIINASTQIQEINMVSPEGKLVAIMHPVNNRIDVSHLADGIYIAEIKVNDVVQRIKWVKM